MKTDIEGVEIYPLKVIADDRGSVRHMLKASDLWFTGFGEIYFSTIHPEVVKAWHLHKAMTLAYACVVGQVAIGLVDSREDSPTRDAQQIVYLASPEVDPESYQLLVVPPRVWNGFRVPVGIEQDATIANCANMAHDPNEIVRVHPMFAPFPFDWGTYQIAG